MTFSTRNRLDNLKQEELCLITKKKQRTMASKIWVFIFIKLSFLICLSDFRSRVWTSYPQSLPPTSPTNLNRFAIHLYLASNFHHVQSQVANGPGVVDAGLWQATHCHVLVPNGLHLTHTQARGSLINVKAIIAFAIIIIIKTFSVLLATLNSPPS